MVLKIIILKKKIGVTDQNFHLYIIIVGHLEHNIVLKWETGFTF